MKNFALPLLAMVFAAPLQAQDAANWQGYSAGLQLDIITDGALVTDLGGGVTVSADLEATQFTFFGGYRQQFSNVVLGTEYDLASGRTTLVGLGGSTRQTVHRLGFELGYAFGDFLPYAGAGIAHIRFNGDGGTFTDTGSYTALGVDYHLRGNSSVGIELTNHSFGELNGGLALPVTPELTTFGINYAVSF